MDMSIRAPYNFVPLSDEVYFPDWADQISHDIPFSDGVSGSMELTIKSVTPIFVRNGHTQNDAKSKNTIYKSFSMTNDGKYFIPATTIKGSLRNVLEILTFGKMYHINDKRYSIRDLNLKKYMEHFQNNQVHCGWMRISGNDVVIVDNGIPRRISYAHLDEKWGTKFNEMCTDPNRFKQGKNISALDMYDTARGNCLDGKFKEYQFSTNPVDKRQMVNFSDNGKEGTIVFTGQPGIRKKATKYNKASGKNFQFVFLKENLGEYKLDYNDEKGIFHDFCFVYKDSELWNYWKKKFEEGESIPIFFSLKDGKICHLGLSYLYKLPYIGCLSSYISKAHNELKSDMADCIFGHVYDSKNALRGRVQFTHAFYDDSQGGGISDELLAVYMASPKPTYYPIYLRQAGMNGSMVNKEGKGIPFLTMLDKNAKLKGWKRYPVRNEVVDSFEISPEQKNNATLFYPMKKGSVFKGRIVFHNLKKIELGALIKSIEINEKGLHTFGFGKPFGYGVVEVRVDNVDILETNLSKDDCKKMFLDFMQEQIDGYSSSMQLNELDKMTRLQQVYTPLEYMELKEFVTCKKQHFKNDRNQCFGEYLPYYSNLIKPAVVNKTSKMKICEAKVTFWDKNIKKACLLSGKDTQSKILEMNGEKVKLKVGDKIEVIKILKGSNVEKLKYKRKI